MRNWIRIGCVVLAAVLVGGVFVGLYTAFSGWGASSGGGAAAGNPLATPSSLEDLIVGFYLQQHQSELTSPAGDNPADVTFTVRAGELPADIAAHLSAAGLIHDSDLFVRLVKYKHVDSNIQAGDYVLRQTMTMDEIVEALQHGRAKTVSIVIRPGWRAEQVAEYLSGLGLANYNSGRFLQTVRSSAYDYSFLRDRPKGASSSLEGFLFPETYNMPIDIQMDGLISLILGTFDQRFTANLRREAASAKLTIFEVVTLASIVEREAVVPDERPLIASVYLNRLKKKQLLQADPTVQYALGFQPATRQWWKTPISLDEYQHVDSPYNTYVHAGLPPGPICSPSLASMIAVLEPASTDYYYFLAKGDGTHAFAKTFEEHQQNLVKYGYSK